ncbi:MAG: putative Serine/threonine-protein phosphatase 2A 65 kDa regulatory subunit A alpha [Streblomastix strix]|uniref:Putative Serine/threonine-protein phosphatase 2A 65 kDa regulatory subunit A alpha n=1 Tax=Streblomastix strix TaxID=222440 RepID=A0A5J4WJB2_9EUKA|nr:MAG: putative Serine/threonine-protein phosphatase 2A 65 kDa regulatory subunit A alpha [Streblomastix strix]
MKREENLIQVALLLDNFKSDDLALRLASVKGLPLICDTLGPERTQKEILPFLNDCLDDEDEVLVALADELGKLQRQVGGNSNVHLLLPLLESLASVEENSVREKAIESLKSLIPLVPQQVIESTVYGQAEELAKGDWFTKRESAVQIIPVVYNSCNQKEKKDELVKTFVGLCADEIPMVRRAAVKAIKNFVSVLDRQTIKSQIIPAMTKLGNDEQDSIRIWIMESLCGIAASLSQTIQQSNSQTNVNSSFTPSSVSVGVDDAKQGVVPIYLRLAKDQSWRVRFKVGEKICRLAEVMPRQLVKSDLLPSFLLLIKDDEMEVRTVCASQLSDFAFFVSDLTSQTPVPAQQQNAIITQIVPVINQLAKDENTTFKESLAGSVMRLVPLVQRQDANVHLLPLVNSFLHPDQPAEVRAAAISNLNSLAKSIEIETICPKIMAAVNGLASDTQWRIRITVAQHILFIAKQLKVQSFNELLLPLCQKQLALDRVHAVREATIIALKDVGSWYGKDWVVKSLLPQVAPLAKDKSYIQRLTALYALTAFTPLVASSALTGGQAQQEAKGGAPSPQTVPSDDTGIRQYIFPILMQLARDPVANVRFTAARALRVCVQNVDGAQAKREIKAVIERLTSDADRDVKYFAGQALVGI